MAFDDRENIPEAELREIVDGLQHFAPLILFIAGLFMYVVLRIQHATNPEASASEIPELFLALDILFVILFPYLFQVIVSRAEERTPARRILAFFTACGVALTISTIARALIAHESMLPIAIDYFTGEIYWMAPLAFISAALGAWWANRRQNDGGATG